MSIVMPCLKEPGKTAAMAVFNALAMKSASPLHTMLAPISLAGNVQRGNSVRARAWRNSVSATSFRNRYHAL
jgi:hypothetical protein